MAFLVSIMANTFEGKIEGVYNNVDYNVKYPSCDSLSYLQCNYMKNFNSTKYFHADRVETLP